MNTRWKTSLSAAILAGAALFALPAAAQAPTPTAGQAETTAAAPAKDNLPICDPAKDKSGRDCHIHDHDTFLKMRPGGPSGYQPHARGEYLKWERDTQHSGK